MRLSDLIDEHTERQSKYFNCDVAQMPEHERAALLLKMTSYIMEECCEVNRELNSHYKPFKNPSKINHAQLREEIADIYLYLAGLTGIAHISGREMEIAISNKIQKNSTRVDHNVEFI